jgi:hypothetical protein
MPAAVIYPLRCPTMRRFADVSHDLHRCFRLTRTLQGLMLIGFLAGMLASALQSIPGAWPQPAVCRMAACDATIPPLGMAFRLSTSSSLTSLEKTPEDGVVRPVAPPRQSLAWGDSDLENENPEPLEVLTAEDPGLAPPAPYALTIHVQYLSFWPIRYLIRPQLLLRL